MSGAWVCAIRQPNLFPQWVALAKLLAADVWVVLDDWAAHLPAWRAAPPAAVAAFSDANAALWTDLAVQDPTRAWKADLAACASTWADFARVARSLGFEQPT